MIKKCQTNDDICELLSYIDKEYKEAIYLYLDANRYGVKNKNVNSWIIKDDNHITAVALVYHTGMHIFSRLKDFNVEEVSEFVLKINPTIICADSTVIRMLSESLPDYISEFGHVAQYVGDENVIEKNNIRKATSHDYKEMAEMLMSDEIGDSYTLEDLENQIIERIRDGFSRSYCMYVDNKMVAQASTGAEQSKVATIAYVMTKKEARGNGYGKEIVRFLCNDLKKDGFDIFLIYYSEEAGSLYLKNGFVNVCKYGKLYQVV